MEFLVWVDDQGRVTIPKAIRNAKGITPGDLVKLEFKAVMRKPEA